MKPALLILAAGLGSRYGGFKQIESVGPSGETLLEYAIFDALRAGFGKLVFVLNSQIEQDFKQRFGDVFERQVQVEYVLQDLSTLPEGYLPNPERSKPWGTGHAVFVAREKIDEPFGVINADDFYGQSAFKTLERFLSRIREKNSSDFCLVAYLLKNVLSENGAVSRGICYKDKENNLEQIIEHTHIETSLSGAISTDKSGKQSLLSPETPVSMNLFGFTPYIFDLLETQLKIFLENNSQSTQAEFFLPFVIDKAIKSSQARVKALQTDERWFGVTYSEDKQRVKEAVQNLISKGVYPEKLWV